MNDDLEIYYATDHRGHRRLLQILSYGTSKHLTIDEQEFCCDYFERGKELVATRELHLQEHTAWTPMNFRGGWDAVRGTQAEILAVIIWNSNNTRTKLRLRAETKEEQMKGMDAVACNSRWRFDYVVQVKPLNRGENPNQLRIDPDRTLKYDSKYVNRLVLVDIDNLLIYHFDYKSFLDYYETCEKYNHGYIDDKFSHLKNFHKFTFNGAG